MSRDRILRWLELVPALDRILKNRQMLRFGPLRRSLAPVWKKGDEMLCDAAPEAAAGGANDPDLVRPDSVLG